MVRRWWIHRMVRKFMQPVELDKAELWQKRLSIGYFLLAWNAFGVILYQYYQGKGDWAKDAGLKTEDEERIPKAAQFANMLGIKNAKVTRVSGFEKVSEYEIVDGVVKNEKNNSINATT